MTSLSPATQRALACGVGLLLGLFAACGPFNPPTTNCTTDADCGLDTLRCNDLGHCEERCTFPDHWCGDRCGQDCGCPAGEKLCQGQCISNNACCDTRDCEGGWECDGGYCCNYTVMTLDDGGAGDIVGCMPRAP